MCFLLVKVRRIRNVKFTFRRICIYRPEKGKAFAILEFLFNNHLFFGKIGDIFQIKLVLKRKETVIFINGV